MFGLPRSTVVKGAVFALLYLAWRRWQAAKRTRRALERKVNVQRDIMVPHLDVKRQAALAKGQAIDHCGAVVEEEDPTFNLDSTIFHTVQGIIPRTIMRKQLARKAHWSDEAIQVIQEAYKSCPKAPPIDRSITNFMMNECNFKMEHADGSFMDHVVFVHDYCAQYYKAQSPRILLLHSIMGVGTNLFPMEKSKIPKLQALVNAEEFKHIEAFPSFLRVLVVGDMLAELAENRSRLDRLEKVRVRRVIDNAQLELDAETFWTHLNHHVVHLIDFLPCADWPERTAEPLFQLFLELRDFLIKANQLRAKVELGSTCGGAPSQEALFASSKRSPWAKIKRSMAAKNVRKYSDAIQHSVEYSLHFRCAASSHSAV